MIILFTTHCPQCKGVELLLKKHNIDYIENTNLDEMQKLNISHVPVLKIDNKLISGKDIYNYINSIK